MHRNYCTEIVQNMFFHLLKNCSLPTWVILFHNIVYFHLWYQHYFSVAKKIFHNGKNGKTLSLKPILLSLRLIVPYLISCGWLFLTKKFSKETTTFYAITFPLLSLILQYQPTLVETSLVFLFNPIKFKLIQDLSLGIPFVKAWYQLTITL